MRWQIAVTSSNVAEYIRLTTQELLTSRRREFKALEDGYQHASLVDTRQALAALRPSELLLLAAGALSIDPQAVFAATIFNRTAMHGGAGAAGESKASAEEAQKFAQQWKQLLLGELNLSSRLHRCLTVCLSVFPLRCLQTSQRASRRRS